jgi:hypothetical protein
MRTAAWQSSCRGGNRDVPLLPTAGVAAVMPWWGILQAPVVQIRHHAEMGAAWHQPSCSLRQRPPATTLMASSFSGRPALHRPLGPPAPPPTARCRAPDTAGPRGCRTAAHRHGRPGSANRRSAGCTDQRRPAWASSCTCEPCRSPSQARGRSPRADESSGRSPGVTALGLLARLPTNPPAGGHGQGGAASRPTVLPAVTASGSPKGIRPEGWSRRGRRCQ